MARSERKRLMLGIEDFWVDAAYVLCLGSSALCVIYAWINWNKGDDSVQEQDKEWAVQEEKVEL
jgi:hypothetical protein